MKDLLRVMKLPDKCGLEAWQAKRLGTSSWHGQLPSPTISTLYQHDLTTSYRHNFSSTYPNTIANHLKNSYEARPVPHHPLPVLCCRIEQPLPFQR